MPGYSRCVLPLATITHVPESAHRDDFKATTEGKMSNVTQQPGDCIDIWPYIRMVQASAELPQRVIDGQLVEYVYRSQFNHYDRVLVPAGRHNVFLVVVVDRVHGSVYGHRILDLNAEYGLANAPK
jgi:hypothetical protein